MKTWYLAIFISIGHLFAQVGPPQMHCLSTNTIGDVTIFWTPPTDPGAQFFEYEIFNSSFQLGPFTSIATITSIATNSYVHVGAGANTQSKYYFIRTKFGPGGANTSKNSDTLRSIFLNLINSNGVVGINFNHLKQPPLSTSSPSFTILREHPPGTWSNLKITQGLSYNDTISVCNVSYNYLVTLGDSKGCLSTSNISGGTYQDKIGPNPTYIDSVSVLPNGQTVIGYPPSISSDCSGYYIYQVINSINTKIDSLAGALSTLYTFTSTSANSSEVKFIIAPFDSCGNPGILNTAHKTMFLVANYNKCKYETRLSWNAYENMRNGIKEYKIYYSVNGGNFQLLGSTPGLTFTHSNVDPDKTVTYFVRAVNGTEDITSSSNRVTFFSYQTPAPDFIYIKSVSVLDDENIKIKFLVDSIKLGNGFDLYRSEDGISFTKIGFIASLATNSYEYTDTDLKTRSKTYFYKAMAKDSCGNDRTTSSVVQAILLKVNNDKNNFFHKKLSWSNYTGFAGGLAGYNIFRVVNDNFPSQPTAYTNGALNEYIDNIEDLAPEGSKIEYYVTAVEGLTNPYGVMETANSNLATTYAEADVFIPTAFAPKGVNRIWKPVTHFVDKTEYQLMIFDRWGKKLFQTDDDNVGWDGAGAPNDAYVYLISYKNSRGEYVELKGTFTLL